MTITLPDPVTKGTTIYLGELAMVDWKCSEGVAHPLLLILSPRVPCPYLSAFWRDRARVFIGNDLCTPESVQNAKGWPHLVRQVSIFAVSPPTFPQRTRKDGAPFFCV
jgi:hypothetical protein